MKNWKEKTENRMKWSVTMKESKDMYWVRSALLKISRVLILYALKSTLVHTKGRQKLS